MPQSYRSTLVFAVHIAGQKQKAGEISLEAVSEDIDVFCDPSLNPSPLLYLLGRYML